jgi:putative glycosyltransferase (TIGR04372 family)
MKICKVIKLVSRKIFILTLFPFSVVYFFSRFLVRPVKIVPLFSSRIGHYITNTDIFIANLQNTSLSQQKKFDYIFVDTPPISNMQIKKMIKRSYKLHSSLFFAVLVYLLKRLDNRNVFWVNLEVQMDRDIYDSLIHSKINFYFTNNELLEGEKFLEKFNLRKNQYVCLHVRDANYLKVVFPEQNYSYHDYRDTDINDYRLLCESLVSCGLKVLRMGKFMAKEIDFANTDIIDYASSSLRSDFLDIYLPSNSKFMISNGSGLDATASMFRKPNLYVNYPNISYPKLWEKNHFVAYKIFRDKISGALLNINELYSRGIETCWNSGHFSEANIELSSLNSHDLREIALEYNSFLDGEFRFSEIDSKNQSDFWNQFRLDPKIHNQNEIRCKISPFYLRKYHEIIEVNF